MHFCTLSRVTETWRDLRSRSEPIKFLNLLKIKSCNQWDQCSRSRQVYVLMLKVQNFSTALRLCRSLLKCHYDVISQYFKKNAFSSDSFNFFWMLFQLDVIMFIIWSLRPERIVSTIEEKIYTLYIIYDFIKKIIQLVICNLTQQMLNFTSKWSLNGSWF